MSEALIESRLSTFFQQQTIEAQMHVQGDGRHFQIRVVTSAFEGLLPVKRQQLVYQALGDAVTSGAVHAVELMLYTPDEWAKARVFQAGD